jgi:osmoprotectant transport system substrate-binding protein
MSSTKLRLVLLAVLVAAVATMVASSGAAPTYVKCTIKGTKKNDVLKGTKKADVICGLAGNDKITGGKGADTLNGGPGNDSLDAADGQADTVIGGPGTDSAKVDPVDTVVGVENVKYTAPILSQFKLSGAEVTVGSKAFTEQLVLGQITKLALQYVGAKVNDQVGLGGTSVNRAALLSGKIDMYWEYTGTGWIVHLKHTDPIPNPQKQYDAVAQEDAGNGIKWLSRAPFNNTYAFAVRKEAVAGLKVTKISDLATLIKTKPNDATICVGNEFSTRNDGLPGVEAAYGLKFPSGNIVKIDEGLIYKSVDEGKICNFGEVFATDGRIEGLGLTVLKDDKEFFPVYNPALNVRASVYAKYPALGPMFKLIADRLTNDVMQKLNSDVDTRGKFPEEVAKSFLKSNQLIG